MKDSVPNEAVATSDKQTPRSGKFYSTNIPVERCALNCWNAHRLLIPNSSLCVCVCVCVCETNLIEGCDINKVDVIADIHVWTKDIYKHKKKRF